MENVMASKEWCKDLLRKGVELGVFIPGEGEIFSVSKLLSLAGITDSYNTLNDAISVDSVSEIIFSKKEAVDYLKANYDSVKDTILSNPTSAKYLGLSDYAFDTLSDGDIDSYINSDNWELLFPFKVPVMTSNTEPIGEVFYNNMRSSTTVIKINPYRSFDGNFDLVKKSNPMYIGFEPSKNGGYVGYMFDTPHLIFKAKIKHLKSIDDDGFGMISRRIRIDASDDNISWDDVSGNIDIINHNEEYIVRINSNYYHKYYRVVIVSSLTDDTTISVGHGWKIQLYGRKL